ncbi:MAG: hypothetical protein EXS05_22965 [Planctomycetaceae bacterium]|nr:hypothetical protein [Planctomycetaceae bacterium]
MSYFSRLSDIISYKLDDLLADSADPPAAIARIVSEIEEGLSGAKRSVTAAAASEQRLRTELVERQGQATFWGKKAREEMSAGNEDAARQSLMRRRETDDLVAGLEQQLAAATSTREHLSTMLRAIEARLAEAQRRQQQFVNPPPATAEPGRAAAGAKSIELPPDRSRDPDIEAELETLRRELRQVR